MDESKWKEARALFEEAVGMPKEERPAFLEAATDDASLRHEVIELLSHHGDAATGFGEPPRTWAAHETAPARPGDTLGDFELLEVLGRGAMGVVFRARQTSLNRPVAVKVLATASQLTAEGVERFRREIAAAARLDHPGLASVLTGDADGEVAWYAMELVDGHGLDHELRIHSHGQDGATLPPSDTSAYVDQVLGIAADVAEALHHAHTRGVVHRDVKPSNILLGSDGRARLIDFGVARDARLGTITNANELVGSLRYMSPEQARVVQRTVDQRTDVYSLGLVLYELLTLRQAFDGGTAHEVLHQIRMREPLPIRAHRRDLPQGLEIVCERAIAKATSERFGTAAEFAAELRRILRGEAVQTAAPSTRLRLRRWCRRHARGIVLCAGVAAALGTGWWLRASTSAPQAPGAVLRVVGGNGARVTARVLDPVTGIPGPSKDLGRAPLTIENLKPSPTRIDVRPDGSPRPRSFIRDLALDFPAEVVVAELRHAEDGAFKDVPPGMVYFEGGAYRADAWSPNPLFERTIEVAPFYLDACEVSVGEFRAFLDSHPGIEAPVEYSRFLADGASDDRPATYVPYSLAVAYAEWCGKRLPTNAEWDLAATASGTRRSIDGAHGLYPQEITPPEPSPGGTRDAQTDDLELMKFQRYRRLTVPVRSLESARTPEGLYHMLGNVVEWTETPWVQMRVKPPVRIAGYRTGRGPGPLCQEERLRDFRAISMLSTSVEKRSWSVGFRCALSAR